MPYIDDALIFFSNQIIQIMVIVGGIVAGIKFLEKKQEGKINNMILNVKSELCNQLHDINKALEHEKEVIDIQIKNIEDKIKFLRGIDNG